MKIVIAPLLVGAVASASIKSDSKVGRKLLSKARRLDGGDEMAWAVNYSIKFEKCVTSNEYNGYFGGNQDDNNNNNFYGMYEQRLVHFKLCPSESCGSGCTGGDYVLDMNEFVQAFIEYKQEAMERECEMVEESCYCENANDDEACLAQCYMNAGIYYNCVEQDNNGNNGQEEEFELEEALECARLDIDEDAMQGYNYQNYQNGGNQGNDQYYNGNGNGEQQEMEYFVGPYCSSDGTSILLGVFMDEMCSYSAPEGIYENTHYGKALPYSSESIVSNECISCMQPAENQNGNNQQQQNGQNYYYYNNGNQNQNQEQPEVLEFCERIYEDAGKCESNMNIYGNYPNTFACEFINGLKSGTKSRISSSLSGFSSSTTPKVLAGVFAATTVVLGGVAYYLHKKVERQTVDLVNGEGTLA